MKVWVVYDSRYWTDPDRASIYFCNSEEDGETLEQTFNDCEGPFDDGVVVEYDEVNGVLWNPKTKIKEKGKMGP